MARAAVGGAGQGVGKILWYLAGTQSLRIRWIRQKMETEKWQLSYEKWHERIVGRPVLAGAISFTSAVTGFPPLAVIGTADQRRYSGRRRSAGSSLSLHTAGELPCSRPRRSPASTTPAS